MLEKCLVRTAPANCVEIINRGINTVMTVEYFCKVCKVGPVIDLLTV